MGYATFGHENKEDVQKTQVDVIKRLIIDRISGKNGFLDLSSSTHVMDDYLRAEGIIDNDTPLLEVENLGGSTSCANRSLPIIFSNGEKVKKEEEEKISGELFRDFICRSPLSQKYFSAAFYWLIYYNSLAFRTGKIVKIHHGNIENMDLSILEKNGIKLKLVNLDFCAGAKPTIFKWIYENRKYFRGAVIVYTFWLEAFSRATGGNNLDRAGWSKFPFVGLKENFNEVDFINLSHIMNYSEVNVTSNEKLKLILGQAKQIIDMCDAASGGNSFSCGFQPTIYKSGECNMVTFIQTFPDNSNIEAVQNEDLTRLEFNSSLVDRIIAKEISISKPQSIVYDKNKADLLDNVSTGKELREEIITKEAFDNFCKVFSVPDKEKLQLFIDSIENRRVKMTEQELPIGEINQRTIYGTFCANLNSYCEKHWNKPKMFMKSQMLRSKAFMTGLTEDDVTRIIEKQIESSDKIVCTNYSVTFRKNNGVGGFGFTAERNNSNSNETTTEGIVGKPVNKTMVSAIENMMSGTIKDNPYAIALENALKIIYEKSKVSTDKENGITVGKLFEIINGKQ